nr:cytochrome P450 [Parafrankia sp. CH37]
MADETDLGGPDMSLDQIDVYDPGRYVQGLPHDEFRILRAQAPVFHHRDPEREAGFWAVTRHADVVHISRSPDQFSSNRETCLLPELTPEALAEQQLMMVNQDPPEHTRLRSLVNRGFTPRMIGRLTEKIRTSCEKIVDRAIEAGEGDFVKICAAELPLVVIAELIGVPHEDRHRLFNWSNRMLASDDPELSADAADQQAAAMEAYAYANELGAARRGCPADDILTKLVTADENGHELSEMEFDLFFILLMVAGNETTRNAISGGMQALLDHPEQWEKLRAGRSDPAVLTRAADEIVRWVSPVMGFRRTTTTDVVLGGQPIAAGEKVVMYYSSANYDESVFADPYRFDIGRDPNPHVGFGGGGPHFCLGKHLAMREIELMLETLVTRLDRVEPIAPARRLRSNFINGVKEMPVRFVPERAE